MRLHHFTQAGLNSQDVETGQLLSEFIVLEEDEQLFLVSDDGGVLAVDVRVEEIAVAETVTVITHPHKVIHVEVDYSGRSISMDVSPGVRVEAIRERSIKELGIAPSDGAELDLRLRGTTEDLDPGTPIGHFAGAHAKVDLELVGKLHPQG